MSMSVQKVDNQQQMKRAKAFAVSMVPAGAVGGALAGYHFAKPWMKGGEVTDKFVKEAMELFGKELPKTVPAPSTTFDHMEKDEIKKLFGDCFKDIKKGTIKSKEELKGSEQLVHDLVEKTVNSLKKSSAIKWGVAIGLVTTLSAIFSLKMLNKVEAKNDEVKKTM